MVAIIATTQWEPTETGAQARAAEIWWRFPKFVFGVFLVASLIITLVTASYSLADFNKRRRELVGLQLQLQLPLASRRLGRLGWRRLPRR